MPRRHSHHPHLIQPLPPGPLDVVGDVHGEYQALRDLLAGLGYDASGHHPQGRTLVFVGDLCDRGPDSVAVLRMVQDLVQRGRACCVLGNHELNLLRADAKDGSGWFFDERVARDARYQPFARPNLAQRHEISAFLRGLPLVLEREDLRVVHAAWQEPQIAQVRGVRGQAHELFTRFEAELKARLFASGSFQRYREAVEQHRAALEDPSRPMPFLDAIADVDEAYQAGNPVKVLTSGVERRAQAPFFSSHKWRFVERVAWWEDYADAVPVLVGHYWRRAVETDRAMVGKGGRDLFRGVGPAQWLGRAGRVFCLDYSVGGRWHERRDGLPLGQAYRLAAMRWPERELMFDQGERLATTGFGAA